MSIDIRPQDLPELRAEMLQYHRSSRRIVKWQELIATGQLDWTDKLSGRPPRPSDSRLLQAQECVRLRGAELFHVSPAMTELALAASESVPDFNVEPEDLPSPSGVMLFGKSIASGVEYAGGAVGVSAVVWSLLDDWGDVLWLSFYAARDEVAAALEPALASTLVAGQRMIYLFGLEAAWALQMGAEDRPQRGTHIDIMGRLLRATWLLMQQPLAEVSEVEADRPARKRLRREGHEPASVRVIELRRPKHSGSEPEESSREYHHRWITRGHWRQQWYATRQVHRPVWIAPHVKGPEGAPMIGGEKVYAWKR